MAKAKKSETSKTETKASAAAEETPKKKAAPAAKKAAPAKKPAASTSNSQPLIDTDLAAANAAKLLVAGFSKSAGNNANAPKQESAMFKNLKAGLNKPSGSGMSNLLDKSHGPALTKSHNAFNKQVGHNQTYGADVNRSGVPRRNPG